MNKLQFNVQLCGDIPHFSHTEFRCPCGCDGYPAYLDARLVYRLELLRRHFGKPVHITSGLRCRDYNSTLKGASSASAHMLGRAADVYISGIHPKQIKAYWSSRGFGYTYYGTPNMGKACHVEVSDSDF